MLLLSSVPKGPLDPGTWLAASPRRVIIAINLMPFAGIKFLGLAMALALLFASQLFDLSFAIFPGVGSSDQPLIRA